MPKSKKDDLTDLAAKVVNDSGFFSREDSPFAAMITPGALRNVVVVVGANASGKSLLVRSINSMALHPNRDIKDGKDSRPGLSISIRERTTSGLGRAFVFGDETISSTGAISAQVVDSAFDNMSDRTGMLILDEPEIGLSQGFCGAMGELIAERTLALPQTCLGLILVSHSKDLVERFRDGLGGRAPTYVALGEGAPSLDTWIATREQCDVADLRALPRKSAENFKLAHKNLGL